MDQVKEYLQIAVKYRFWIVVGIAAIMPLIGYFAAAGSIEEQTVAKEGEVKSAVDGVQKYSNGEVINDQYAPLVEDKTKILTSDVNAAWEKLYDRQAPLLTWPEPVAQRFQDWGPKWPENSDPTLVKQAVIDYVETYRPYVDGVYQTLKPFDFETGEGIVVAPPSEVLLMFPEYNLNKLPDYGKVWNTQRRLWVQSTVLDVLAKVNERAGAKDWSSAAVKQILDLQVANNLAQDQRSMGKGDALKEAPKIDAPGSEAAPAPAAGAGADPSGMAGGGAAGGYSDPGASMGGMGGMMGGMGGMMGGMGGMGMGMNGQNLEVFKLLPVPNDQQVYVVPVYLSVYVEQDRIPDLIVEFSNSPMNIQIIEFAMYKAEPGAVTKPEKGDTPPGMANMRNMGMFGEMMMGAGMMDPGMMTGGAMSEMYQQEMMMMQQGMMQQDMMQQGMMQGMGGTEKKKGTDVRAKTRARLKGETEEDEESKDEEGKEKAKKKKNVDQYYNVVRVDLYGQARFFFPPPKPEEPQPSASVASEVAGADGAPAETPAAETGTAEPGAETPAAGAETAQADSGPAAPAGAADPTMPAPAPGTGPAPDVTDKPAEPTGSAQPAEGQTPAQGAAPSEQPNSTSAPEPAPAPAPSPEPAPAPAPDAGAAPKAP